MRRAGLFMLLALFVSSEAATADENWSSLQAEYRRLFTPLPVKRMFSPDLERELKSSRRDPFTAEARAEIAKARDVIKLRRAQIVGERAKREAFLQGLVATKHERTGATLMTAFDRVLADLDLATKNLERHVEALRRDINPGVDPGGLYWKRWAGKERGAAQAVVNAEDELLDYLLVELSKIHEPDVRAWFRKHAATNSRRDVRTRMLHALAHGADPGANAVLRAILAGERETWARTRIVVELASGNPAGAKETLLGALKDTAWPVRAAALSALRKLDARDAEVVDALIRALESEEGRLKLDVRNMLVWATGVTFGPSAAAWRTWWDADGGADWPTLPKPAAMPPAEGPGVARCFATPTTSERIVFLINGGAGMRSPATRRALGNDGKPSPEPRVDTSYRIATWELEEALATLAPEALFTVVICGREAMPWSLKLKRASKSNRSKAVRFVGKHAPDGGAAIALGLEFALRIDQPLKLDDVTYGSEAGVDTVFIVGGSNPVKADARLALRRVRVVPVNIAALATE